MSFQFPSTPEQEERALRAVSLLRDLPNIFPDWPIAEIAFVLQIPKIQAKEIWENFRFKDIIHAVRRTACSR